nr:hypothetical protein [Tanacetum cinerariifolium]
GGLGGYSESRSDRSGSRVKGFRRIRVGSWNTKWKGYSNKEVNGYKLWYSGSQTARNEVGVILRACLKDKVVNMNRCNDVIISLTLVIEGETVNVISVYAPQVGLSEEEKKALWDSLDEVVRETSTDQRLILRGDLNRNIGETTKGYSVVHGGFGYGLRNEEGRSILDFATAHDLAVVNSYFKKRDHHLITFQSRGRCTQIDYLLVRRGDLMACKDCKVFPGEACYFQHRLLAMDTLFKRGQRRRDSLGVAIGTSKTHTDRRESWWLCEEVQYKVAEKQAMFKELLTYQEGNLEEQLRAQERYKLAKREAKKVVAHAKEQAYESLYKKLDFKEGENEISRITKARQRRRWDLGDICFIKDEAGRTIMDEEEIKQRGENTFPLFSTQENQRDTKELWTRTHYCLSIVTTRGLVRRKATSGPAIISYLFALILDELSRGIQDDIPWCMIFADDIMLVSESAEGLNDRLENWREALEANGLRVSREKTEYLRCDFSNSEIAHNKEVKVCIGDKILQPKESFRHLGSMLYKSRRIDKDVAHRIKAA